MVVLVLQWIMMPSSQPTKRSKHRHSSSLPSSPMEINQELSESTTVEESKILQSIKISIIDKRKWTKANHDRIRKIHRSHRAAAASAVPSTRNMEQEEPFVIYGVSQRGWGGFYSEESVKGNGITTRMKKEEKHTPSINNSSSVPSSHDRQKIQPTIKPRNL